VGVFVLDVQAHMWVFYHMSLPFYHKLPDTSKLS
jgi:hypothetical protein